VYCDLQNCTDVLEHVPGLFTETCLTACDAAIKVEDGSYVSEEEDPLAVTLPATEAEQEVSNVQQTSYSLALLGCRWCRKYPVTISGTIWAVLTEVFVGFHSASKTVVGFCLNRRQQLY
jgi:hypothetical protein